MRWQKPDFLCSHRIPTGQDGFGSITSAFTVGNTGFLFSQSALLHITQQL